MGYIIVRITNKISARPYIAWVDVEETTIAEPMRNWITEGETMEILDYQPDRHPHNDPFLIPDLNLWRGHLEKEQNDDRQKQH